MNKWQASANEIDLAKGSYVGDNYQRNQA